MQKKLLYIGSIVILILAAITFIFVPGMADAVKNNGIPAFGKYDGKPIEYTQDSDFANAVSQYAEYFKNQGRQLNESDYFYIYSYAFNSTVQSRAATSAVEKAGFIPTEKSVNKILNRYYADETGKFSRKVYNSVPESERISLKNNIIHDLKLSQYQRDNFGYEIGKEKFMGLKSSSKETAFLAKMGEDEYNFELAAFETSAFPEDKVKEYAEKNPDLFAKLNLNAITVKDEAKAKSVLKQVNSNEITFADAVQTYSDKYYTNADGKVDSSYCYQIKNMLSNKDDLKILESLEKDSVSEAIKTTNGYTIFQCVDNSEKADFSNKETLETVKNYIVSNESGLVDEYYMELGTKIKEMASTASFEKICKDYSAEYSKADGFQLNYGNSDLFAKMPEGASKLGNLCANEAFMKLAFALKEGEVSVPVKVASKIIVAKLVSVSKAKVDDDKDSKINDSLKSFDSASAQTALFNSPKVENNVAQVYFQYFVNNK